VICVIPVALGIVLIGALVLASAVAGALATVVIHSRQGAGHGRPASDRQGCPARVASGVSLVASLRLFRASWSEFTLGSASPRE
jgi:hypothetical protein